MEIIDIYSITEDLNGAYIVDLTYQNGDEGVTRSVVVYRSSDNYGLSPLLRQWITDNNPEILPYAPPAPPTPEELRAAMPDKTPREFRDALVDMGIDPKQVTARIEAIPFDIERQKALNAWEVSTYISRTDPYVDMIGAMFDKTPEEIDAAWVTATVHS